MRLVEVQNFKNEEGGGKVMAEERDKTFELQDRISGLEKQLLELRHSQGDALRESINSFREEMKSDLVNSNSILLSLADGETKLANELTTVIKDVSGKAGKGEVRDLVSQCLADPDGPLCSVVKQTFKLTDSHFADKLRDLEKERKAEDEGSHNVHEKASEFL